MNRFRLSSKNITFVGAFRKQETRKSNLLKCKKTNLKKLKVICWKLTGKQTKERKCAQVEEAGSESSTNIAVERKTGPEWKRRWIFSSFKWTLSLSTQFREKSVARYNRGMTKSKIFVPVNTLVCPNSLETFLLSKEVLRNWEPQRITWWVAVPRGSSALPRKGCPALNSARPRPRAGWQEGWPQRGFVHTAT